MRKTLITIATLFTLTGCSPVIERLLPNDPSPQACTPSPATSCPSPTPPPLTPLFVAQTCPEALAIHPNLVLLLNKCPAVLQAVALGLGQRP